MKSFTFLRLVRLLSLFIATSFLNLPVFAQLDTNANGLSDVWERQYNEGNLFDPANPDHAPEADADGDGWTTIEEAVAGTNPFNGKPPEGIVSALISHLSDQPEPPSPEFPDGRTVDVAILSWDTLPGKQYILTASPDLSAGSWLPVGDPIQGDGNPAANAITLTDSTGETPERLFWRVQVEDLDSDSDTLTDHEEIMLGTNPFLASTFSGISDVWVAEHFHDSIASFDPDSDADADGLSNFMEFILGTDPNDSDSDDDGVTDGGEDDQDTDPNDPEDTPDAEWVILTGDLEEDIQATKSRTITIPSGESRVIVVFVASEEYYFYTDPETANEFNDILSWDIRPADLSPLTGNINVNSRDAQWDEAAANGLTAQVFSPVHAETVMTVKAPDDESLDIEIDLTATNIGDGILPSTVMVGFLPVEVNSLDRFVRGSINLDTVENIFGGIDNFGVQFVGKNTDQTYGEIALDEAYIHDENFLNSEEEAAQPLADLEEKSWQQDVIFYKKDGKLYFMTTVDQIDDFEIKFFKEGEEFVAIDYQLTEINEVSGFINELDRTFDQMPFANNGVIPSQFIADATGPEYDDFFPELPSNPVPPALTEPEQLSGLDNPFDPVEWRNLTTRCMEALFEKLEEKIVITAGKIAQGSEIIVKQTVGYATGYLRGLWGGLKSDWEGILELKELLLHPIDTSRAIYEGFDALLGLSFDEWKQISKHMLDSMMDSAKEALPWEYKGDNLADQAGLISHINGYASGFVSEQALLIYLGAGAVSKIGQTLKIIVNASKAGNLATKLAGKGLNATRNLARRAKTSAQKYWSQFADSEDDLARIGANIEGSHKRPGTPRHDGSFGNAQRALGEALNDLDNLTVEKLLKELGDTDTFKQLDVPDLRGRSHVMQFQRRAGQFATTLKKADALSEDALIGFARLYKNLIKDDLVDSGGMVIRERVRDLTDLFDTSLANFSTNLGPQKVKGAKALAKSLEDYKVRSEAADFDGKFWFKDVETVYEKGYRYQNWDPRFDIEGNELQPPFKLGENLSVDDGTYISFDRFGDADLARKKAQLPNQNTAEYRIEFDVADVSESIHVPRGLQHTDEAFEPLAVDFPNLPQPGQGIGGASQALVKDAELPVKAIYRIINGIEEKIY